jgi:hypothetical protein
MPLGKEDHLKPKKMFRGFLDIALIYLTNLGRKS